MMFHFQKKMNLKNIDQINIGPMLEFMVSIFFIFRSLITFLRMFLDTAKNIKLLIIHQWMINNNFPSSIILH